MEEWYYKGMEKDTLLEIKKHYYGDIVRQLFLSAAVIMLVGLPIFAGQLRLGIFAAVMGVLVIGLFAGMTSPKQKIIMITDVCIALIGSVVFEVTAVYSYRSNVFFQPYFFFNQVLALIFFVATYLAVKSARGMIINK